MMGNIEDSLISPRYEYDNVSPIKLNKVQVQYRQRFMDDCESGRIKLENVETCLCGGRDFRRIAGKDRFGLPFSQLACKSCGVLSSNPRLSSETIAYYYDAIYHSLNFGVKPGTVLPFLHLPNQGTRVFQFLAKHFPNKGAVSIAEIGCGRGTNLEQIGSHCARELGVRADLYGCEYNRSYVESGRERALKLFVGGTEVLVQLGQKFDAVIISHVLEHFADVAQELKLCKDLLSEDSLLYVEVPGVLDLKNKFEYHCDLIKYTIHAHNYNFGLATLSNTLARHGLALVEGNEHVQSVFRLNPDVGAPANADTAGCYDEIITYLEDVERNRERYLSLDPKRRLSYRLPHLPHRVVRKIKRTFF